ncbi:hypothetical protein [Micromonospora taraxaci]|uniref:hypothetical protein n=1 Tax=Micromonospora taraxaci TaxID=1316803 RepID=UPI003C2F12DE
MTLQSGRNPSAQLEALRLFSLLDAGNSAGTLISDAERVESFVSGIASGLEESLANPSRLHGWRVQSMFEAMIVGLGDVQLVKEEDVGTYFYSSQAGDVRVPDFRLVRLDGEQLLVEVKGVDPKQVLRPQRIREADVNALQRYANLTGARLLLAHYWSAMNLWTLVDPKVFRRHNSKLVVEIERAMKESELGLLGDAMVATVAPLVLSLSADTSKIEPPTLVENARAGLDFKVAGVEVSAGGAVLTDAIERKIAWFLMQFGRWRFDKNVITDKGIIRRIDLVFSPKESVPGQGFDMVGQLSSMYSSLYNLSTLTEAGEVLGLRHEVTPGMLGTLIPGDYFDQPNRSLKLWKFIQQPSSTPGAGAGAT